MSTLKVDGIRSNSATSDAITLASDGTCTANITNNLSNRNKVINGSMIVSQRGTSFASTLSDGQYTIDRFAHSIRGTNDSYYTQVSDSPDGFTKSIKVTCNSTYTPSGSDNAGFMTSLEGQDIQDFAFGTSSAKSITMSFYAKSGSQNNGHQYSFQLRTHPSGGATNRIVTKSFTVTSSWQKFSFTFAGDTGADITVGNTVGIQCCWWLDAGPDDIISQVNSFTSNGGYRAVTGQDHFLNNTSNEFYLTGVQLEIDNTGSGVATDFEHRLFGQELELCKRYFEKSYNIGTAVGTATNVGSVMFLSNRNSGSPHTMLRLQTQKRSTPTLAMYDPSQSNTNGMRDLDNSTTYTSVAMNRAGETGCTAYSNTSIAMGFFLQFHYTADAEL